MESEERRERVRRRNKPDRDRCIAESAQQREAWLARPRVKYRALRALRSAAQWERVFGHRRGRLASETPDQRMSRPELGRALAQIIETTSKKA